MPAGQRDVLVFDDTLSGFGIRKFARGRATYIVKYNVGAQQRRHSLGPVVHGNLKAMRLEASAILAKARLGRDVAAEKRAAASKNTVTLGEIVPRYLEACASELRPKTLSEVTRYIERSFKPLHKQPVDGVTRQQIVSVIDDLEAVNGKVAAGVSTRTLRRMAARDLIKITKLTERKHGLSEEEHAKFIDGRAA